MTDELETLRIERSVLAVPKPRRWLKRVVGTGTVLVIITWFALAILRRPETVEVASVASVWPSSSLSVLNATGYVVAQRKAAVSSKATGRLEWLGVREGSEVKTDEVIARLENRDLKAQVDQASAAVEVAQAQVGEARAALDNDRLVFRRAQDLVRKKLLSSAEFDAAKAQFERSEAHVTAAEANVKAARAAESAAQVAYDYTFIRAPFDGVILTKNANVGDVLSPFNTGLDSKGAVVNMADMDTLEVEADVSESSLFKVKVGQPCEIQLDALPETRLLGEVASMVPSVDRSKATVTFKVRFVERDPRVLPDMSAKVAFLSRALTVDERAPRIGIDPKTVLERDGKSWVFIVADGKVHQQALNLGETLGDMRVVTSGVKPGDKLVLNPSSKLHDGAAVSLAEH